MKKYFINERGITLVELLAVFVIGSIIVSIVFGIHVSIQKQYNYQKSNIEYFYDLTTGTHAITKDIRKSEHIKVEDNKIDMWWNGTNPEEDTPTRTYELDGNDLKRNGGIFISDIVTLEIMTNIVEVEEGEEPAELPLYEQVTLFIESESGRNIETEITLR